MSSEGYIKLYHSFLEWEWYADLNVQAVFLHLLLTVNHKEVKFQGKIFKKGSRRVSNRDLAEETGLSVQNVKTAISKLERSGYITKELVKGVNVIIVPDIDQPRPGSYVKLYRKFTSWQWYKSNKEKSIYVYSLLHARRFNIEENGTILKVGSYAKNFTNIAKDLGLSIKNVRTAFKNLTLAGDLRTATGHKLRVISVCKYVDYHAYKEDTNPVPAAGSDTIPENFKNSGCVDGHENCGITDEVSTSYDLQGLPGNQLVNQRLTTDQPPLNPLYNKRDKSDKSERVQDKTRQSSAPALTSSSVSTFISEEEVAEAYMDFGLLTTEEKNYILQEVYRRVPEKAMELFNQTVRDIYALSTYEDITYHRDEAVVFQVEAYMESIHISSEEDKIGAAIKWTIFRYKEHYLINIPQDVVAKLLYEIFTVTIPVDKNVRLRLLRCLETLSKYGVAGSELYSFFHWCRTHAFADKPPGMDVVQAYLFNSRQLPKLIAQYFQ
jgi:hypothetical protein